ncbi:hypothetical protein [Actinosynnema sp. ALI-1.44]|uniref:hypothetical protein n=1 Tax=Actinosynnema sp. ALI-1.44 TaxID=1933779 RepID=UPI00143D8836|nr:hypothetical protein [Actinosynnema sp. ALI-1.44]
MTGSKPKNSRRTAFTESNCQPPKRLVRPDGTVLQIYDLRPTYDKVTRSLQSVTQTMSIYFPDHTVYRLTVQNWGQKDLAAHKDSGAPIRVGAGRPTLPLSEYQLSQLGEKLVG